jgi:hypothetical protein
MAPLSAEFVAGTCAAFKDVWSKPSLPRTISIPEE